MFCSIFTGRTPEYFLIFTRNHHERGMNKKEKNEKIIFLLSQNSDYTNYYKNNCVQFNLVQVKYVCM
jgi:hypothetical protein